MGVILLYNEHYKDTITAIATPIGTAGLAVIRISGKKTFQIMNRIFQPKKPVTKYKSWSAYIGYIVEEENIIDEVIVTFYHHPRSYTTEDMVEISCHGGVLIVNKISEIILNNGARMAAPGEFTKRAFLSGRIDLSRAEAVADLIHSQTELSRRVSLNLLEGDLQNKLSNFREQIVDALSLLEIELDFSEEDIEFIDRNILQEKIEQIDAELGELIDSFKKGKIIKNGINLVIVGKPNVGKSSLLNVLLRQDRAIVTDIPGTTRDALVEQIDINGLLFNVVDTAGIINADNPIEREGINRTRQHIKNADIVLHLLDIAEPLSKQDIDIINILSTLYLEKKLKLIVVLNKIDLPQSIDISKSFYQDSKIDIVETSMKILSGIDNLEQTLFKLAMSGDDITFKSDEVILSKLRHFESVRNARNSIQHALSSMNSGMSSEFIAIDLRDALTYLGEITGEVTNEEILNNIFDKFCIGK